jgi:glycosyltransferase involved in cell wall biosynthesis
VREAASLLVVGSSFGAQLQQLRTYHPSIQVVTAEAAAATATIYQHSPGNCLAGWLAATDEVERAAIGAILLGRDTGRADVQLLFDRLHPHQRLIVEPGAATVPWLFALWDGVAARHDGLLVFSEPGHRFREPSTRMLLEGKSTWPRISVVTVSFNQCEYLEQCLNSVLDQDYPNLEYIVVDGGSTDGSVEVLEHFRHRLTRLIIEPDHGQSDGLNKGLGQATGEILTWVNSDDMLAPLALRRAALAFARSGAEIVAGTCSRISSDGRLHYRHHSILPIDVPVPLQLKSLINWSEVWEKGCYFFQPEVFFRRDIWLRAGGYLKPYLHWAMDWDLWLRFALAGAQAVRTPDVLGVSREHPAQKTRGDEMYLWQILNLLREYDDLFAMIEDSTVTGRLESRKPACP